jgi:hypothetical protein
MREGIPAYSRTVHNALSVASLRLGMQYINLIECMEKAQKTIPANAEECVQTVKMDWPKLTRCVHEEGEALLRSSFEHSIGEKAPPVHVLTSTADAASAVWRGVPLRACWRSGCTHRSHASVNNRLGVGGVFGGWQVRDRTAFSTTGRGQCPECTVLLRVPSLTELRLLLSVWILAPGISAALSHQQKVFRNEVGCDTRWFQVTETPTMVISRAGFREKIDDPSNQTQVCMPLWSHIHRSLALRKASQHAHAHARTHTHTLAARQFGSAEPPRAGCRIAV